jgi:murein DD-endopeptidase MepM/ murein hydrolase activator NlpD
VRPFDPPARPWLSGHRGVDLAAGPGAGVVAPQAGTVSFSGWVVDRPVVTIDHGGGLRSSFEPVEGSVPVGSVVATGATVGVLATAAAAHCERSPCLHWGVRRGEEYVDPVSFIEDRRPSVLLPWDGPR